MLTTTARYGLVLLLVLIVGGGSALTYFAWQQTKTIDMLLLERHYFSQQHASTTRAFTESQNQVSALTAELTNVREDLEDLLSDYAQEQNRNEEFEDQIRALAGTVGTLDKLAQIDEELLQKYSRVSFLNENYIPRKLVAIDSDFVHPSAGDEYFLADAYDHLEDLMRAAKRANIDLSILSAYRSFEYQTELKGRYLVTYGEGANAFSADQGFSEHQLGTSVDFTTGSGGGLTSGFASTPAYEWLLDNAYRYGFILSYPEGNQFYVFEPWHWRFVGRDLARDLHRADANFYDWDQREINEYLINIFE
jgi:LAS superfamily LD-carboxypeptidase LdcB